MRGKEVELQSARKCSCNLGTQSHQNNGEGSQHNYNHKRQKRFSYGFYKREEVSESNIWQVFFVFHYLNPCHSLTNLACIL